MSARKNPSERSNREKPVYKDIAITWDGQMRGPNLPSGYKWCVMTKRWWKMIRCSPQAMSFHETDWYHMLETARLHNRFWGKNVEKLDSGVVVEIGIKPTEATALAGEIRRRTEAYGFTWADRRKYGIHISTDQEVTTEAEQVTKSAAVDYRRKLNGLD